MHIKNRHPINLWKAAGSLNLEETFPDKLILARNVGSKCYCVDEYKTECLTPALAWVFVDQLRHS